MGISDVYHSVAFLISTAGVYIYAIISFNGTGSSPAVSMYSVECLGVCVCVRQDSEVVRALAQ